MKNMKNKRLFVGLVFVLFGNLLVADNKSTSWISPETLASVVHLGVVVDEYYVEGLPENYEYKEVSGKPNFGTGKLIHQSLNFGYIGSGVLVTENGLIVSNAHVTDKYEAPEVTHELFTEEGKRLVGLSGKPVSRVRKKKYPGKMFVGVADKNAIENNDERIHLKYVAHVLFDDSYDNYGKKIIDRAVLQITNAIEFDKENIPLIGERINAEAFPSAKLANPFKYDYLEKKVRAVGFPGVGDPIRATVTEGEMIGYEEKRSVVLHTSFISYGNSGGGLFYKDALIGINTWDNQENVSRPVAKAQPVSYWNEAFSKIKWAFPSVKLPEYSYEWIKNDPFYSPEKDEAEAIVYFSLMQAQNSKTPVESGYLVAMNESLSEFDYFAIQLCYYKYFSVWEDIFYDAKKGTSYEEILTKYKEYDYITITESLLEFFKSLNTFYDMRNYLDDSDLERFF